MQSKVVVNQKGAERIQAGHPWVFRSDVADSGGAQDGDVVTIHSKRDRFLGQAFFNSRSQITVRMVTRSREPIDRGFFRKKIEESISRRQHLSGREGQRLVFGESDFLPALILDRYQNVLVFQTLNAGIERWKEDLISLFQELLDPAAIVERNDLLVRDLEGLPKQKGIIRGGLPGELQIREGEKSFLVDPLEGQKTGLFLDQVENRLVAANYARGRVLDLFCYQGGFAIQASSRAEEVVAVDSSASALSFLKRNLAENQISNVTPIESNAFDFLRDCQNRREKFDRVILDPPPFARDKKNLIGAARGYKEINLRAMKILAPGGILVTCSCSQNFSESSLYETLLSAAQDTGREIQVLERRGAAPDHPVLLTFPESSYLQCWILRVI